MTIRSKDFILSSLEYITFSCSDLSSINLSFACNILSFFKDSPSWFADFKIIEASVFASFIILVAFDFSNIFAITKPTKIPQIKNITVVVVNSIIVKLLNKNTYDSYGFV